MPPCIEKPDPQCAEPQPRHPSHDGVAVPWSWVVVPERAGQRLDHFLAIATPLSRSHLQSLIAQGQVTIDGRSIRRPAFRLRAQQNLELRHPIPQDAQPQPEPIPLTVVYEDSSLLVIDKPAGLVVHPAPGHPGKTLVNALLAHCAGSLSGIGGVMRPGIVHRLDQDTSGLLVAAKTEAAHLSLSAQFAAHSIERSYIAFCQGVPHPKGGVISAPIGRAPYHRQKMAVHPQGRSAETHYRVTTCYNELRAAQVCCRLSTGRTHQIRVHLSFIGCPLLGDRKYGAKRLDSTLRAASADLTRQALHAKTLGFLHPNDGRFLRFTSPLPSELRILKDRLSTAPTPKPP